MDGRTIQEARQRALDLGATPIGVIDALADIDAPVPPIVMTYYNLILRLGHERQAQALGNAASAARDHPRPPLDEFDGWGDKPTPPMLRRYCSRR